MDTKGRVLKKRRDGSKSFSHAGRTILIKSVIQAIPSYAVQCYLLLAGFLNKLMSHVKHFFWGGDAHEKHIHWVKWECMCHPKEEGGHRFRDLNAFNLALLAKQAWFGSNYGLRSNNVFDNFTSRISSLIDIFPSKSQALKLLASIAITSWNIWKARNKFIFEHTPLCPSQVISASNVMQGAIGIVGRDSEGVILACIGERWQASSPLAMELLAIRNACNLALANGWVGAIFKSDSTDAIALSSSESVPPWAVGVIVADIRVWASRLNLQFS
nr:cytochrome P450 [Tanacetum cinerariifolium]